MSGTTKGPCEECGYDACRCDWDGNPGAATTGRHLRRLTFDSGGPRAPISSLLLVQGETNEQM